MMTGTYASNKMSPPYPGKAWWKLGSSPKMITSTTGRPMLPIMFTGWRRTSLASLSTTWPNAAARGVLGNGRARDRDSDSELMPGLLRGAGSFR